VYLVRPSYLIKKLYPGAIWRIGAEKKIVYLTFDDGPVPEVTEWVLDLLKEKNIKATFFCVGSNVKKNPEIFRRIIKENHSIGNHTENHLNGWKSTSDEYRKNIEECQDTFRKYSLNDTPLFRPPYGKMKQSNIAHLKSKYSIIMWDVLSGDYDKKTSPQKCFENVAENFREGSIVVFHDSYKAEENLKFALPRFIDHAAGMGYSFGIL
jgi:peptidoglycan-N-acetylglucosamine deacetylase